MLIAPPKSRSRFPYKGRPPIVLRPDHAAVVERRTTARSTRRLAGPTDWPLIRGTNNSKLGHTVSKGPLAGMPMFYLGLEERATCAPNLPCHRWCWTARMARKTKRWMPDGLLTALDENLQTLAVDCPEGFVVRLHTSGDFGPDPDDTSYVDWWIAARERFKPLRLWGYTGHSPQSAIGRAIIAARERFGFINNFAMRFSNSDVSTMGSNVIASAQGIKPPGIKPPTHPAFDCPVETGRAPNCGSCAACWSTTKNVNFLFHG